MVFKINEGEAKKENEEYKKKVQKIILWQKENKEHLYALTKDVLDCKVRPEDKEIVHYLTVFNCYKDVFPEYPTLHTELSDGEKEYFTVVERLYTMITEKA